MLLNAENPTKYLVFQAKCLFNVVNVHVGFTVKMSSGCLDIFAFEDGCTLLLIEDSKSEKTIENAIDVLPENIVSQCAHSTIDFHFKPCEFDYSFSYLSHWYLLHTIDLSLDVISLHLPVICLSCHAVYIKFATLISKQRRINSLCSFLDTIHGMRLSWLAANCFFTDRAGGLLSWPAAIFMAVDIVTLTWAKIHSNVVVSGQTVNSLGDADEVVLWTAGEEKAIKGCFEVRMELLISEEVRVERRNGCFACQ